MAEYVPVAPNSDDAKKHNENLPGMGGVYNYVNLHVYHYGGNNPIKYVDPDGRNDKPARTWNGGVNQLFLRNNTPPLPTPSPLDIIATEDGVVGFSGWFNPNVHHGRGAGFGWFTRIDRPDGSSEFFAHLDTESTLPVGTEVKAGVTGVGRVAIPSNGWTTGDHVHHEIRDAQGNPVDPGETSVFRDGQSRVSSRFNESRLIEGETDIHRGVDHVRAQE
jgi:hypothetical protein